MGIVFGARILTNVARKRTHKVNRAAPQRHYIREWRRHRGYTQEELADLLGATASSISQLENNKQGYSQATLEAIAVILECTPADLLSRDPNDTENIWALWNEALPEQRQKLLQIGKILVKGET